MSGSNICLGRMYYPVKTLGPGNRVGIWTLGCERNCKGCISPEFQVYDKSREVSVEDVMRMVAQIRTEIDGFTISGGEPFYNPNALRLLVDALCAVNEDILIFTGYTLEELKNQNNEDIDSVLDKCAALVDGAYIEKLNDGMGLRGSSNQKYHIFKLREKYAGIDRTDRNIQTVVFDGKVLNIGIPRGEFE